MNDLKGTGVALVTPFNSDRSIDYKSLAKLINFVIENRVNYVVVMGTTGEAPTIAWRDQLEVLDFSIKEVNNRVPVVFGLGGNNTYDMAEKCQELAHYNISALLSASPYYNRPSQAGILAHYHVIADSSPAPIILYNVPARTGSNIEAETSILLSQYDNIIGLKEASGSLDQFKTIKNGIADDFLLLSGDDCLTLSSIKLGGHGIISVVANLVPKLFSEMVSTALSGDFEKALSLNNDLSEIYDLASQEGNPTSIKTGMQSQGLIKNFMRLPLVEGSMELEEKFKKALT